MIHNLYFFHQEAESSDYKRAVGAYNKAMAYYRTPSHVITDCFRIILEELSLAKNAYQDRKLDVMCAHNTKIFKIVAVLRVNLPQGGEHARASRYMAQVYDNLTYHLANIYKHKNGAAAFDSLSALVRPLYTVWQEACSREENILTDKNQ